MVKGIVTGKIDYYSSMFYDVAFSDVLQWLNVDVTEFRSEFQDAQRKQFFGMESWYFEHDHIVLYAKNCGYYGIDDVNFFDRVLPSIKLDLSGQALDSLRSRWKHDLDRMAVSAESYISVDDFLRNADYRLNDKQNVTRVDYAIDFVNYAPNFLNEILWYIDDYSTDSGMIMCVGGKGKSFRYRTFGGSSKGCYIGSSGSDRFLRIYDKRIEQTDYRTGVYSKPNPYNNPDSWIRIELQCRNKGKVRAADRLLYTIGDYKSVLKWITDYYGLADVNKPHPYPLVRFWADVMDWSKIEPLCTEYSFWSTRNRASDVFDHWEKQRGNEIVGTVVAQKYGVSADEEMVAYLDWLQTPNPIPHIEVIRLRKLNRFLDKLSDVGITESDLKSGRYSLGLSNNRLEWLGYNRMNEYTKGEKQNEHLENSRYLSLYH